MLSAKKLAGKPPPDVEAVTVRASVVVSVTPPDVPVMVIVDVPVAAELATVSVSELVFVVEAGLKVAVTPVGSPDAERATEPLNPPEGTTVMVSFADPP